MSVPMPFQRYTPFPPVEIADRTWPSRTITAAPSGAASTCVTATRH
jgi:2-isopropylmalate synthase